MVGVKQLANSVGLDEMQTSALLGSVLAPSVGTSTSKRKHSISKHPTNRPALVEAESSLRAECRPWQCLEAPILDKTEADDSGASTGGVLGRGGGSIQRKTFLRLRCLFAVMDQQRLEETRAWLLQSAVHHRWLVTSLVADWAAGCCWLCWGIISG